jgi:hypothetical protein
VLSTRALAETVARLGEQTSSHEQFGGIDATELDARSCFASTKQPFTYKDPCVELNPHVGFDPAATEAAKISVKQFLRTAFKL